MSSTTGNDQHGGGSGEMISSKKECTSCEQTNVDNITEDFNIVALNDMSTCANCGKEGNSDDMNICNKCKMVKYCNAACKKKHRSKHKKACERRVAEMHDEKLFKDHPPSEECPICMLPMPIDAGKTTFQACCGKTICSGCIYALEESEGGVGLCPFCRTPASSSPEEHINRTKKLMDKGNAEAFNQLAGLYAQGRMGMPQDRGKANELNLKAGELGCDNGYFNLGNSYRDGKGVTADTEKANYYFELAAMNGSISARNNLGCLEHRAGNYERAYKHFIIAARAGDMASLNNVKKGFMKGVVTKDEYEMTLRAYHERQKEMKSDERDKADASDIFI